MQRLDDDTRKMIIRFNTECKSYATIAKLCNVSKSTVSRVINEKREPQSINIAYEILTPITNNTINKEETQQEEAPDWTDEPEPHFNLEEFLSTDRPNVPSTWGYRWEDKGRHFWYVVYPDSAEPDWKRQLDDTGLPWHESPIHDMDMTATGMHKKPHYHVIVSYGNATTYRNACQLLSITHGRPPMMIRRVNRAYRYARHADDPDKFQYDSSGKAHNGWTVPLEATEVYAIIDELTDAIFDEDCKEVTELYLIAKDLGTTYTHVYYDRIYLFERITRSYRHNPRAYLYRRLQQIETKLEEGCTGNERKELEAKRDELTERLKSLRKFERDKGDNDYESYY